MSSWPRLQIESTYGSARQAWYTEYRQLRHRIFVREQGWGGLSAEAEPDVTREDPADAQALFWLAWSEAGQLIGAVRVRAVADLFPRRELFAHHLARPEVAAMLPWMATLNSLAVLREHRGLIWHDAEGREATVARHLLRAAVGGSGDAGLVAIVATAQHLVSARALMGVGFHVIDPPVRTPLHATFRLCNVGIALPAPRVGRGSIEMEYCRQVLSAYFARREQLVLDSRTIDELFASGEVRAGCDAPVADLATTGA